MFLTMNNSSDLSQNAATPLAFNPFQVAGLQMVSTPVVQENLDQAAALIEQAAGAGAALISLPEYFCFMGHADRDKWKIKEVAGAGPIQEFLSDQARKHKVCIAGGTLPLVMPDDNRVFNTSIVFDAAGEPCARYDKIHLFKFARGGESYDESIAIGPGNKPVHFNLNGAEIGLSVCYDLRFPELYRALGAPALVLVPAAFTYTTGRAHWELLLRARAVENQCYVLAAAQGGKHPNGRRTWGHTMLIDPWGDIVDVLAEGPGVVAGTIEPSRLAEVRSSLPALQHRVM